MVDTEEAMRRILELVKANLPEHQLKLEIEIILEDYQDYVVEIGRNPW